jgi:hypothetical protein
MMHKSLAGLGYLFFKWTTPGPAVALTPDNKSDDS